MATEPAMVMAMSAWPSRARSTTMSTRARPTPARVLSRRIRPTRKTQSSRPPITATAMAPLLSRRRSPIPRRHFRPYRYGYGPRYGYLPRTHYGYGPRYGYAHRYQPYYGGHRALRRYY